MPFESAAATQHAGQSAEAEYRARYRRWRARTWFVVALAMVPVPALMVVGSLVWPAHESFFLGMAVGSTITFPFIVSFAPEHIDRWRRGAEAEKRTAKELRRLENQGWTILHDLPDGERWNRDHVAVAPSGDVFLLDTKAPRGKISVNRGVLEVKWLDAPGDGYKRDLTPRMNGAAAGLASDLAQALPWRTWVTPIVVIWGRWDGPPHVHDRVAWVPGRLIADRLSEHAGRPDPARHAAVAHALTVLNRPDQGRRGAGAPPRSDGGGAHGAGAHAVGAHAPSALMSA
jgi:hypothetical protein